MDRRETERLVHAIREAYATGARVALATVVRVRGSAYRREGTRMLVHGDGTYECTLSGSCLEPSVAERAQRVIANGAPVIVDYDLADDSLWGSGLGCNGAVDIRLERVEDDALTREWLDVLQRAEPAVLVTPLAGVSGRMIVRRADVSGGLDDPSAERAGIERARRRLEEPHPSSGAEMVGQAELFFEVSDPPPQLVIFGAGHDAVPVAQLAWTVGFGVTVVDPRATFLTPERFPGATLVLAHVDELPDKVALTSRTFVVILNHHAERDRGSVRFAVAAGAAYIGVLGPRARYERLLADLTAEGFTPASALAHVRSPVGLSLGADTPEEVAVSIVGEILAVHRGFDGGFLRGWEGSLHRPVESRAFARS